MAEILLEIDCGEETCDACICHDDQRNYCGAFGDFTDNGERLSECMNAEDMIGDLLSEDDEED